MSLGSILDTIETDVLNIVHAAEAKAEDWFKSFTPVVEADVAAAWSQFKPIVIGLIVGIEQAAIPLLAAGTGFDKLGAVVEGLLAAAGAQGVTLVRSVATTIVQQAVTSIGNAGGTGVSTTTATTATATATDTVKTTTTTQTPPA